ncbi:30S ribosomal protein S16 [Neochlamydia sp. EPS4]|uniref:30S ribosomal protein S16 n=1 Tax=Neochlamydia sp. EPS4 TaxID=1478175 RepID=UPI0005D10F70|nr:30S ribosomal protein S16 [Neochlamydia sp. EPS4]
MALKIRLRQQGRHNRPFYRLVVADGRSPRDGKYVEAIGWYNPFATQVEQEFSLDAERAQHWLSQGAVLTDSAEALIKKSAPSLVRGLVDKKLALRAKYAVKRKARKKVST